MLVEEVKEVKIQIDDTCWIFNQPLSAEMFQVLSFDPVPYEFCLRIKTLNAPMVYRIKQDGNVTEYEKLS